ncbi:hypothetical protein BMETH_1691812237, partial [methanotrophic bacterial endosymbiont of Bathymodiolus sp.]
METPLEIKAYHEALSSDERKIALALYH